jgi:6-pyruvoyltetrahydropterin/6-carboxytetrahydropterin synthase
MFDLSVEASFSAAHQVKGYPGDCAGVHGHTYRVQAKISVSNLNKLGMAIDFRRVKSVLNSVIKKLDHANLNSISFFKKRNATAEWIAVYIYTQMKKKIKDISCITVWEGTDSAVTYRET